MTEIEEELRLAKEICVTTKISMSQHKAQQATGIRKEKSIATKEFPVAIEIGKDSKKLCHNRENSITIELTG